MPYLVEHYGGGKTAANAAALTSRLARAARSRDDGARLIGSACVPGDESFLSLYDAPSADAVAAAVERAGVIPDRIVPILWVWAEREDG